MCSTIKYLQNQGLKLLYRFFGFASKQQLLYQKTMHSPRKSWLESLQAFLHPRVITMLFFGFSAGIPILLIFSSLSLWLREAGVSRSAVTYFSWAALGYSFKFIWAPLTDIMPLPWITSKLGRRRSWILLSQVMIIIAIISMAMTDPAQGQSALTVMALACVLLGFSSATQDIVIDAYRIESAGKALQAMMSSSYIAGYRIAMILAGAGTLYMAQSFGTTKDVYLYTAWQKSYLLMALAMIIGIITTLMVSEPKVETQDLRQDSDTQELLIIFGFFVLCVLAFVGVFYLTGTPATHVKATLKSILHNKALSAFLVEGIRLALACMSVLGVSRLLAFIYADASITVQKMYLHPIQDFFLRHKNKGVWFLLAFIGIYRMSDIVLGVISNVFYQDMGFTKAHIAMVSKTYGLIMTLVGGFLGGIFAMRFGLIKSLLWGAILSSLTNLLFIVLAHSGADLWLLTGVISLDNLSAGFASAAFIAFLSALTSIKFTAMQYAIFSSIMTLFPKIIGGYSGSMVESMGYGAFFLMTTLLGVPVIYLIFKIRHFNVVDELTQD